LAGVDRNIVALLALVWYWVGGTMAVFGVLLIWAWWRIRSGDKNLFFLPWTIGACYLLEGVWGTVYLAAFFSLFIVQAALLYTSAWMLRYDIVSKSTI
jgi:hypothetical protein